VPNGEAGAARARTVSRRGGDQHNRSRGRPCVSSSCASA
jgi:hypothetical protein